MGVLTRQVLDVVNTFSRRAQAPQQVRSAFRCCCNRITDVPLPYQAGIFVGANPATYNANDPIQLWVIQVSK